MKNVPNEYRKCHSAKDKTKVPKVAQLCHISHHWCETKIEMENLSMLSRPKRPNRHWYSPDVDSRPSCWNFTNCPIINLIIQYLVIFQPFIINITHTTYRMSLSITLQLEIWYEYGIHLDYFEENQRYVFLDIWPWFLNYDIWVLTFR